MMDVNDVNKKNEEFKGLALNKILKSKEEETKALKKLLEALKKDSSQEMKNKSNQ